MNSRFQQDTVIKFNPWAIATVVLLIVLLGGWWYFASRDNSQQAGVYQPAAGTTKAALAGSISWSGLTPDPEDQGLINIMLRPAGTNENFQDLGLALSIQNQTWRFDNAVEGDNYEIYGTLSVNGRVISQSPIETVTAPALNIPIDFNISWADLGLDPGSIAEEKKTISGKYSINGYLPTSTKLTITETVSGRTTDLTTLDVTTSENVFTIVDVDPHANYVFSATLKNRNGVVIGKSSQSITANLGDNQVNFVINSTVTPPTAAPVPTPTPTPRPTPTPTPIQTGPVILPPNSTPYPNQNGNQNMSGWININGPLERDSRLLILGKRPEDNDYQVWTTITDPRNDGQYWSYSGAVTGQWYMVKAELRVRDSYMSSSSQTSVVAPASNLNFSLNTNFSISTPSDDKIPRAEPCQRDGDRWFTYVTIPKIDGAGQYWLMVGDNWGSSNFYNQKLAATDNELRVRVSGLTSGQKYMDFSYAWCRNCSSDSNFSPWSRSVGFTCN